MEITAIIAVVHCLIVCLLADSSSLIKAALHRVKKHTWANLHGFDSSVKFILL